ncbi:hypothetical protein [Streptomyces avermitilis]
MDLDREFKAALTADTIAVIVIPTQLQKAMSQALRAARSERGQQPWTLN